MDVGVRPGGCLYMDLYVEGPGGYLALQGWTWKFPGGGGAGEWGEVVVQYKGRVLGDLSGDRGGPDRSFKEGPGPG